jgi:hypothetical protein
MIHSGSDGYADAHILRLSWTISTACFIILKQEKQQTLSRVSSTTVTAKLEQEETELVEWKGKNVFNFDIFPTYV